MIPLFHIPSYTIDTGQFSNLLHDKIVRKFEEDFCQYVDAKYGCSLHSATAAIELIFESVLDETELAGIIKIPSIIPPVVPNAVMHGISSSGCGIEFTDNVNWVGHA
ncbi:MAG TPA: DegT/DnrJ/EryC1/StrS family aminotransferase, partial [Puia sp.]|nr:DegT/DnrJ/EryC1/StrS family aminotransferase [Puia sp.]